MGDTHLPRNRLRSSVQPLRSAEMAAMKAKVMTKGALTAAIAEGCELKRATAAQVISTLASIGTEETKKNGMFVIPGLVMIKTRKKPTKAAKKEMFGKVVLVKARPARTVVKAFPAKMLK